VSQGESAVTDPQVSAADGAQAEQAPDDAVRENADARPDEVSDQDDDAADDEAYGDGVSDNDVSDDEGDEDERFGDVGSGDEDDGPAQETGEVAPGLTDVADLELEGEIAADYIEGLLDVADLDGDIDMDVEGDRAVVSVVGATLNELVGSRGEVLEALQELTRLAVHRQTGTRTRIMIDVGGYRMRRRAELAETGRDAADEVKRTGLPKKLWAMNPFERKIVHDAVAAAGLRSESEGEEPDRRVVVLPGS
jgi:spoIIIJ-associated protein